MSADARAGDGGRLSGLSVFFLAALAVLPYANGLTGDFTYDDKLIIRDNERLASPSRVSEVFTTHYFGGSLATGTAYRPLVLLTYAVQRWLHGNRVVWFHAVNVALHAGTTVLFAAWLFATGFSRGRTMAAATLFATVTIHAEAVTGLVGRAEVLAALLVFLSALLWLRATEGERVRALPYVGSLLTFLAAVFVKENAVVLPGVVALSELFRGGSPRRLRDLGRETPRGRLSAFLGLLLPIGVLFAARRLVLKGFLISTEAGIFDLENPLVAMKPLLRASNALVLLFRYVWKTLVPVGLSADHSAYALPLAQGWGETRAWIGWAGVLLAALLTLRLWKTRPLAALGACLFFGTFLPAANLLFPIGTIYAERLMYLPSAGIAAIAVGLLAPEARAVPRPSALAWREAVLAAAVLAYGAATLARNPVFANDTALYADMVAKTPSSAKAHYDFAYDAQRRGEPALAKEHLLKATAIFPRYYDAWALLGKLAWDAKRWDEAIAAYLRSAEIFPKYESARWGLAKTLQEAGRPEEAEKAFDEGVKELPESYPLAFHRAAFFEERGRLEEAEREWVRAVKAGKGAALARLSHGRLLARLGREEEAWDEARRALAKEPGFVEARLFLAERYERAGKTLAAAGELTRAWRSRPGDPEPAVRLLELGLAHPEARGRAAMYFSGFEARFGRKPQDERLRELFGKYRG